LPRLASRFWWAPHGSDRWWLARRRGRRRGKRVVVGGINSRPGSGRVCPGDGRLSCPGPGERDWREVDARREADWSASLVALVVAVDPYHVPYFDQCCGDGLQRDDGAGRHNGCVPRVEIGNGGGGAGDGRRLGEGPRRHNQRARREALGDRVRAVVDVGRNVDGPRALAIGRRIETGATLATCTAVTLSIAAVSRR
jgi:hypothetical protein